MKKIMVAFTGLFLSSVAMAAEYEGNPDRLPSIGINYSGLAETGDFTVTSSGVSAQQDMTIANGMLALDARLPISNSTTLNFAVGIIGSETTADETSLLTGGKSKSRGFSFNVGARFYIH